MMTKKNFFEQIVSLSLSDEMTEFATHQLEILSRPRAKSTAPTKTQRENEGIKQTVVAILAAVDAPMSIKEMLETGDLTKEDGSPLSVQKVNSLLIQLKKEGKVTRMEGKTALFSLA